MPLSAGEISQVYEVVMWMLYEELAWVETLNDPLVGGLNPFERY